MASQQEIVAFLKNDLGAEQLADNAFKVTVTWDEENRSQLVFAMVGETMLGLQSIFALKNQVSLEKAFSAVSDSTLLGMASMGEAYVLRHTVPIEDIDASEVHFGFSLIAEAADSLEQMISGKDDY